MYGLAEGFCLFISTLHAPPELLPPFMGSLDSNRVDKFEIYRRFCDIRSGNSYKENNNQLDDETQSGKRSRDDELAHLLKFVELNIHTRTSVFDELAKFKSRLDFMVSFSEFSCFYDFVYFICRECRRVSLLGKAIAAWRLVLSGRFQLLNRWCDFVQENQRYNISEDTWQQVLVFSRCVHENLEGYDPEGAWPVLIDDFVEHIYRVSGSNKDLNVFCNCNCGDSESQSFVFKDALPGLKVTPGLKRKMPDFEDEMDVTDSPSPVIAGLHVASSSKRNRLISHRQMSLLDNSAGDCMEIIKHSSKLGSSKPPSAVKGCLSKGFSGMFSTHSYLRLNHERTRLSFT